MTREVSHFLMFAAAVADIQPNFPPGVLQGDARFTHRYYNMSDGANVRGPWNEGQGPWNDGEKWVYVADPVSQTREARGNLDTRPEGTSHSNTDLKAPSGRNEAPR